MPRCNDCGKMVSLDTEQEPEVLSGPDIEGNEIVVVELRRFLQCADCGTDLRETNFNIEALITQEDGSDLPPCPSGEDGQHLFEEINGEPTYASFEEAGGRYAKKYYGVSVDGDVVCANCGNRYYFKASYKEAASNFDEC